MAETTLIAKEEIHTGLNRLEKPIYNDADKIIEFQVITDSNEMFYHLHLSREIRHFSKFRLSMSVNYVVLHMH